MNRLTPEMEDRARRTRCSCDDTDCVMESQLLDELDCLRSQNKDIVTALNSKSEECVGLIKERDSIRRSYEFANLDIDDAEQNSKQLLDEVLALKKDLDLLGAESEKWKNQALIAGQRILRTENERDLLKIDSEMYKTEKELLKIENEKLSQSLSKSDASFLENERDILQNLLDGYKHGYEAFKARVFRLESEKNTENAESYFERNEKTKQRLKNRIFDLRNTLQSITITQCPHFNTMKCSCTCIYCTHIYDDAMDALRIDNQLDDESAKD